MFVPYRQLVPPRACAAHERRRMQATNMSTPTQRQVTQENHTRTSCTPYHPATEPCSPSSSSRHSIAPTSLGIHRQPIQPRPTTVIRGSHVPAIISRKFAHQAGAAAAAPAPLTECAAWVVASHIDVHEPASHVLSVIGSAVSEVRKCARTQGACITPNSRQRWISAAGRLLYSLALIGRSYSADQHLVSVEHSGI